MATTPNRPRPLASVALALLDVLLPPACGGCGDRLATGELCEPCRAQLSHITSPRCPRCGLPFEGAGPDHLCRRCIVEPPPFASTTSAFVFDGPLADGLRALKYGPRPERIAPLAHLWRASPLALPEALDLAVPVPLHPGRRRARGFNQTVQLAKPLLQARRLRLAYNGLSRRGDSPSQAGLSDQARRTAQRRAFFVPTRGRAALLGARVLLVDDIMTTGGTAAACARALLEAGAAEVHVATLARTVKWR